MESRTSLWLCLCLSIARPSMVLMLWIVLAGLPGCESDVNDPIPIGPSPPFVVDYAPTWAPDGSSVVYYRDLPSESGVPGFYLVGSDGTSNQLLLAGHQDLRPHIRFSPDGDRLSLILGGELFVFDMEGRDLQQLTTSDRNAGAADWSPNGHFIVYDRYPRMFVVDVRTGEERVLEHDGEPVRGTHPRWSPQGEPIAFMAARLEGIPTEVFTIHSDGSALTQVTDAAAELGAAALPRWFCDGSQLIYLWVAQGLDNREETRIIDIEESSQRTFPFKLEFDDAISPDCGEIVTAAYQDDTYIVLFIRDIADTTGSGMRRLTHYFGQ